MATPSLQGRSSAKGIQNQFVGKLIAVFVPPTVKSADGV